MSDTYELYVVEQWAALSDPYPSKFRKDGRERSEPMSLEEAQRLHDHLANWHKKPNGTDDPWKFPLEPKIIKLAIEETR